MADSIEGFVPIPAGMTEEQYQACAFPWVAKQRVNNRLELKPQFQDTITAKAYRGAGFKIAGRWLNKDPATRRLAGYWLSMNVPTCSIGNNVVLTNGVSRACELAVMYLKIWARELGCSPAGLDALNFENMRLSAVTCTFLHDLGSREAALEANREVRLLMEYHNKAKAPGKKQQRRAFGVGTTEESTAYLHGREVDIAGYVKDRHLDTAQEFETEAIRVRAYDHGECQLRLEVLVKGAWLKEKKLDRPEDWRLYGGDGPYPRIYALLRKALRLDEDLRTDEPTDQEWELLSVSDQEVVRFHISGHNAAEHPTVVGTRIKLAQQKYLYDLKARVLKRLRIDFGIPWARQIAAPRSRLRELLHYPGMYVPPVELQDAAYSPHSVPRLAHELELRFAAMMPRRLADIVLDPRTMDPPPVKLGRLEVSDAARRTLDKHKLPLHHLLCCHELGGWGEVSTEESQRLSEAAGAAKAVTSRFPIFDRVVLVTTDPDLGTTTVYRLDEQR